MIYALEIENTTKLLGYITDLKEREIALYRKKTQELKAVLEQDHNLINEYKYKFAKLRYDQLKETAAGLQQLEKKIESIKS
ncbi:hypothetical protein [Winogradskyella bathintestinalis]|uniref:Uncharacterized protein n=1 Tax=Winogradskyella bathintestinalis TaxID=3035208 RepID=A0ABT7ZRT7_9FLAO|nr:hypothetical protein [Winogradskyella bathintestinalis]MDN3491715.1 hypothetical protein [Winogradskyella bathintestinalis]